MSSIYESVVDPLRPNDAHGFALQLIGSGKTVLELGAAAGHVTKVLRALGNSVTAVERDGRLADALRGITDEVLITDLDWLDLRQITEGKKFDVILAGDVLEHCSRPDLVALQCHSLLNPGGYVVVSIPNIAHGDVRLALLAGKFDYRQSGLLDQTHVRFFTRASLERFVTGVGFRITEIFASTAPVGGTEFGPPDPGIPREAIEYVQSDRDHVVYQYVARLEPAPGFNVPDLPPATVKPIDKLLAEVCLTQEALAATSERLQRESVLSEKLEVESTRSMDLESRLLISERELVTLQEQLTAAHEQLTSLKTENDQIQEENKLLHLNLLGARDFAIGAAAELGEMRHRHQIARAEVDSLVHQINIIHGSRTWRIGRFVLRPLRGIQWIMRKLRG